ncbi:MAG: 3-oxoacyl-ACP synthase, partial [Elusimicrobia bacterium]|nr:3-oxoacyl-ACP synthase [Elusimicrobiota bacterium]
MESILVEQSPHAPVVAQAPLIAGVGLASPALQVSQADVLDFVVRRFGLSPAAEVLYRRTLGNAAIDTRHFAMASLDEALETDPDRVVARFQRAGTELSVEALRLALADAHAAPAAVDFLVLATCTGYLCPGLSSYVLERAGLRRDVRVADLVGMGCGAAIPALEQASNFVRANPGAVAAVVCTEICSAAFFASEDPDIV